MTRFTLLLCAFSLHQLVVHAQPFVRSVEPFPVRERGNALALPFAGGINSPLHQFVDIDGDGDMDLFVFDVDFSMNYYRNEGTRLQPIFKLRNELISLPSFLVWFRFVDFDGDGRVDFCTEDSLYQGVRVYKNVGTPSTPQFVIMMATLRDTSGAEVYTGGNSIPAFVDIDGDGDLDLFSGNTTGTVNFYKNVGNATTPRYAFVSGSWENILIFGDTCTTTLAPVGRALHGAAAYSFADVDGDGDPDFFVGDLYHTGIFFLRNTGTPQTPHMECGTAWFPPNQPLMSGGFNQTSFVDIDGDGDLDLFVGTLAGIVQRDGFIFYRNTGTTTAPLYQLVTRNYITAIDVGISARPVFADIDTDGDPDMFIGNLNGEVAFYRNTGTAQLPSYDLVDSAFVHLTNNYYASPAFVDIDGDGDLDLFVGTFDGTMKYFINIGTPNNPQFASSPFITDTIDVGFAAAPVFVDIDADGRKDLFIGNKRGEVRFYRNVGSATAFVPQLVAERFLDIALGDDTFITPTFADIDNDGDFDFFYGRENGSIVFYENTGSATSPHFVLRSLRFAATAPTQESAPSFCDIDADGDVDLFVGIRRGGLFFYRNDRLTTVPEATTPSSFTLLQNSPNPFGSATGSGQSFTRITFSIPTASHTTVKVYDVLGREVATLLNAPKEPGVYEVVWDARNVPSGVYFYRLSAGRATAVKRMLVVK
ncbi:MAG: hypothetical protein C4326_11160 [Ignavibacteria bacterium]